MVGFIRGLFGGGSWGIYLVAIAVISAFYLERGHMKQSIKDLKSDLVAANIAKDSAVQAQLSLARTDTRRQDQNAKSQKEEDELNALPITNECSQSKPVRSVVGRMFDNQNSTAGSDTD